MKKIINGKLYDTETATCVGSWANSYSSRDFQSVEEELYRKRTGEFFLYGEGGPASKYAVSVGGNSWSGGAKIIPLTVEQAREWAEQHMDADDYQEIFGEVAEDDSRTALSISLSSSAAETARRAAALSGTTLSAYIESLIWLNAKKID